MAITYDPATGTYKDNSTGQTVTNVNGPAGGQLGHGAQVQIWTNGQSVPGTIQGTQAVPDRKQN